MIEMVLEVLSEIRPEFDFRDSNNFISEGMLDSFDIIALVSDLDKKCGISILGSDIVPENFKNVGSITSLLSNYGVTNESFV